MKILCCGDRNWTDKNTILWALMLLSGVKLVIQGGCRGADKLSAEAADELGIPVAEFPADWEKYGKSAGPIRNRQMLDQKPDLVLAFHDNIKQSRGTADTVREAKRRGINTIVMSSDRVEVLLEKLNSNSESSV